MDAIKESGGLVGLNFAVYDMREDGNRVEDTPFEVMLRQIDYLVGRVGIDGLVVRAGHGLQRGPAQGRGQRAAGRDPNRVRVSSLLWKKFRIS